MTRRWTLLAGALALSLSVPQAAFAAPPRPSVDASTGAEAAAADALRELKVDADGAVRVQRDAQGVVAFVSSTDGGAMLESDASTPRRSAQEELAEYGDAFGIDGSTSRAVVTQTLDSSTGGSVVRSEQVVDGVPVFGGQVVMSLDEDQGLVSVASATTDATEVPAAKVSEPQARQSALRAMARNHRVSVGSLSATSVGRRVYDPALVHTADPLGVRPVWQFEVTNGSDIRETVLVGTGHGEIALHFNDAPGINRRICDNANVRKSGTSVQVPVCPLPARSEGGSAGGADVSAAYTNLGVVSQAYAELDGLDLTDLIGANISSQKTLQSTVRWCYTETEDDDPTECPYDNAFWDGRQMVFGEGYAAADDVVGHELTHGYVERTSNLFMFHQSGAINESVADTIGEIVDHRNGVESDAGWTIAEQIPGGPIRSMKTPALFGQPDRMTSPDFVTADVFYDGGAVHDNDGVGNKTAYLISQGGTFNGHTITGIDTGDSTLAKTGRLYLETIPRLTSGSEYADLGRVLVATCDELATAGTGGFTTGNCDAVREAVVATELSSAPTDPDAAAAEAPISCPTGNPVDTLLARDDDDFDDFEFSSTSPLWGRADGDVIPSYAVSGTESLFGLNPDPSLGDPSSGSVTSAPFTVPATGGGTYLNFHHAYVLDFDDTAYYDGGQVVVSKLVNGSWVRVNDLPWVNGPSKHIEGSTAAGFTGFGGDSRGYGSSQVDLSSLAGQRVQVAFRLEGDPEISFYGWWIDDVRMYACDTQALPPAAPVAPGAPTSAAVRAATTSAVVSWQPPVDRGSKPITSYRITRSDGKVNTAAATARSLNITGLRANANVTFTVRAVNGAGLTGPGRAVTAYATAASVKASAAKIKRGTYVTLTATVSRRGSATRVRGMPVTLQRHARGATVWRRVSTGTTGATGLKAWRVKQSSVTYYRVVTSGTTTWLGSTSGARAVSVR